MRILVRMGGLEPPRASTQRIFLLLYVTIAVLRRCSLDYVFTISFDLGGWCIVSTHLFFSTIFSSITISKCMTIRTQ
jgi:hypothetical protein